MLTLRWNSSTIFVVNGNFRDTNTRNIKNSSGGRHQWKKRRQGRNFGLWSSDFVVSSPDDDHQGDIEAAIGGCDAQCKACIGSDVLLSLISHNCFVYSPRECRDTKLVVLHFKSVVSSWEREEDNWITKIFVKIQGADLWRFDKHKKRATLGTGEYPPVMNCTLFAVHKALKYEWVIIPYHLMLYTKGVAE